MDGSWPLVIRNTFFVYFRNSTVGFHPLFVYLRIMKYLNRIPFSLGAAMTISALKIVLMWFGVGASHMPGLSYVVFGVLAFVAVCVVLVGDDEDAALT